MAVVVFVVFLIAYRTYGQFIGYRVFGVTNDNTTPAHTLEDGQDYVPTKTEVLFGHHYTSIAGAAPIVGPAIAVIWGWVPALLWVVCGTIFAGAVHDFAALLLSSRNEGRSMGEIASRLITPRTKVLFLLISWFANLMVIAVFALVIAVLFGDFPTAVFPIWMEVPTAIVIGYLVYRKGMPILPLSIGGLILLYLYVIIGWQMPLHLPAFFAGNAILSWSLILFIYAYVASVLPVWVLLQPRDFINSHQLYVGLGLIFIGLIVVHPQIVAPVLQAAPKGAPSIIPFLFITIACGAISGFHSLVSSGTSSKQLDREEDAVTIGYGAMLGEGVLATFAVLACTAGFATHADWLKHYASWSAASGLGAKVGAFVDGSAHFLAGLGLPAGLGATIMAVIVVSFAATTMDSATRIQRYLTQELAETYNVKPLTGVHGPTLFAVITAFLLTTINGGKGGLTIWPLFGTTNQLLAGLALLVASVYLLRSGRNYWYTLAPFLFMLVMTTWAMLENLSNYFGASNWLLTAVGAILLVFEIWIVFEAIGAFRPPAEGDMPTEMAD